MVDTLLIPCHVPGLAAGLVEYGSQPLYADPPNSNAATYDRGSYDSAANAVDQDDRHRRRRRHRSRRGAESDADVDEDYAEVDSREESPKRSRSRSRLRNLAAGGAAAAAAAIGIKKYEDRKKRSDTKKRDDERSRDSGSVYNDDYDRERHRSQDRHRRHGKNHRRDDDETYDGGYYDFDDSRPPSPPHASGGAYYPPGAAMGSTEGFTQHPNANISNSYMSYNPNDHSDFPPPPGPPPTHQGTAADGLYGTPPPHAGPAPGVVYPGAAGPLPPKADPTVYGAPATQSSHPASYPQPPVAPDPTRSANVANPNDPQQPFPQAQPPHDNDHNL